MDRQVRESQMEYNKMSNLVLQRDPNARRTNEPAGEAESLAGRAKYKFGGLVMHETPPELREHLDNKKKRKVERKQNQEIDPRKRVDIGLGPSESVLGVDIGEKTVYRAKTKETKKIYEEYLSITQNYMGDVPHDTIKSAADETILTLKSDIKDSDKRIEVESLLDKIPDEIFNKMLLMAKSLVDFHPDEMEERDKNDENINVAVEFDDEALLDEDNEFDTESEADNDGEEKEEGDEMKDALRAKVEGEVDNVEEEKDGVNISIDNIDAYWLQKELSKYFKDVNVVMKLEKDILEILASKNDRECENRLITLLDFDKWDFIKLLYNNRWIIHYGIRIQRAENNSEKESILKEMGNSKDGEFVLSLLERSEGKKKNVKTSLSKKALVKEVNNIDLSNIQMEGVHTKDEDIHNAPKKQLDFDNLIFQQGGHYMNSKVCSLPKYTTCDLKKGYEEVHVPALQQKESDEKLIKIKSLPEWIQPVFPEPIKTLNRIQSRIFEAAFKTPENLLVCAPTGAGKTNIALLTILHQMSLHRRKNGTLDIKAFKIIYVAPMKALVTEVVGNFQRRLESFDLKVRELTGDMQLTKKQIDDTQIIVTTPEKWDIITRKSGERAYLDLVKLIIIDEIHLLHDMRGPVLESIVSRTIRQIEMTQELVRIVALSATLPNYEDVAAFLRVKIDKGLFYFDNSFRPVPLEQIYIGITENSAIKKMLLMNEILYEKVMERAGKHQMLVFVHSRKETVRTAKAMRDMALAKDEVGKFLRESQASIEILQNLGETAMNLDLKDLLPYGIGIHHAGLSRPDRSLVEDLFSGGHIQMLVSTATLAWGVNLPAHTVIIKGTQIYSPELGKWIELSPQDILQMMGRAGRPQYDKRGEGIIISSHQELQFYLSLNNQQLPIESQFITQLADHLNAEIVMGTVSNTKEAVNWLAYTYLYIRMLRAPVVYGLTLEEAANDITLLQRRADLIHTAAKLLEKANLIKYDVKTGLFQVTALGKVASHYYIKHNSMSVYNENLKSTMGMIELFRLFSLSKEFQFIPVRDEEKLELLKFMEKVPIPVKGSLEEPSSKINILLQAYISRFKMDGYALNADMVYVTQSASRIMRALFEICLKRNWSQITETVLKVCKMIDRQMWTVMTPLRQFVGIPEDILRIIEKKEQFTWDHYYDMSAQQIGEIIKYPKMGKAIHRLVHQFPRLELAAYVQPITRSCIRIELTITPDFQWDEKIHGYAESFHILVEDVDSEIILHNEIFILKHKFTQEEHIVTFTVELYDPLPPQYFIKVISDRWLHAETLLPVSFRHLILPEKFSPHTKLLDMEPLPVNNFKWKEAEQLFNDFEEFNPIQTQVFKSLYESNDNIFIGAPTNSGKTVCAELAILKELSSDDLGKIVYIAPLESLCKLIYNKWIKSFKEIFNLDIVELTGQTIYDIKLMEASDIIISTPEKWDSLSRRWKQRKVIQNISLLIVDEIHLIGESGSVLEVIVSRMRYMTSQIERRMRIVALSTSLANSKDIAEWIGATSNNTFNFSPSVRPIPLEIHIHGFDHNDKSSRVLAMAKPAYRSIKQHANNKPVIIFVSDRKQSRLVSLDMITYAASDNAENCFLRVKADKIKEYEGIIKEETLKHTLQFGIGYLHDGLSAEEKVFVRELFKQEAILVLVVTYNLCWELNDIFSCLVIILDAQKYDGHEHRYVEYAIPDMLQMMGRAGRIMDDDYGKCVLFCHTPKKNYFRKFLYEPFPIESHLDHFLHDHLNAEIGSGIIGSTQDAVDWITWTFMYRRLTQNPNYYNLQGISGQHINDHLSELIENTVEDLVNARAITVDMDSNLTIANLGRIASYYYIKYSTVELYATSLNEERKMKGLLEILSSAHEFETIPIRHGEDSSLKALVPFLTYKIDKDKYNEPQTKTNILLQSHFSRNSLSYDFAADQKFVLEICLKLIQAIVDIISSNGWLKPALSAVELSQMVVQAMWISQSPLYQLPHFDRDLVDKCKSKNINDIVDIMNMEDDERNELLQMDENDIADIAKVCNNYPSVEMKCEIDTETEIKEGDDVTLDVTLIRDAVEERNVVYAPYYPKEKLEEWWIIIGAAESNKLIAIKRVSIKDSMVVKIKFIAPEVGEYELTAYLLCDSYIGCDQEEKFMLRVV